MRIIPPKAPRTSGISGRLEAKISFPGRSETDTNGNQGLLGIKGCNCSSRRECVLKRDACVPPFSSQTGGMMTLKKLQFPQESDSRRRERLVPGAAEPQEELERDFPEFLLTWQHTLPERLEVRQ